MCTGIVADKLLISRVATRLLVTLAMNACLILLIILLTGCQPITSLAKKQQASSLNDKLFLSASKGNLKDVEELLDKGASINAKDAEEETPLMYAAAEGQNDVILLLLRRGADIHARSANGQTALGRAALFGRASTVEVLLDHSANVDEHMDEGGTPLMYAADVPTARALLNRKARINTRNEAGITALMGAAANGKADLVKLLIDAGADVKIADYNGKTALDRALERNYPDIVTILNDAVKGLK